nr:hypothetical protein [Mesorhizobium sp. B2-4-19]
MNLIGLLDRPTTGEIKIDAGTVQHLTSDELATKRNQGDWICLSVPFICCSICRHSTM